MTLNDLIIYASNLSGTMSSGDIPIRFCGTDADLHLLICQDEQENYYVELEIH